MSVQLINTVETSLSDEELREIDAELAHAPYRAAVAIDALKIVQAHRGWVSDESLKALSAYLDMSPGELDGIATFYNLIFRRPVGDQVILVCGSVSCWVCGSDAVNRAVMDKLGIQPGETTGDGKYTLLPITCLGACDKAPVLMVGDRKFENVRPEDVDAILDRGEGATPA